MKSKNLRLFSISILILLIYSQVIAFTFQVDALAEDDDKLNLRIGSYQNPPKIYYDENDKIQGFFPDILGYIAEKENWDLTYVNGTWQECLERLEQGSIDIMVDVGYSTAREELYDFNNESALTNWGIIYAKSAENYQSILDLQDTQIAVMNGSIHYSGDHGIKALTEEFNINCNFTVVNSYYDAMESVNEGKADVAAVNRLFGNLNGKNYHLEKTNIIFNPTDVKFAFPKNATLNSQLIPRIDYWLTQLKNTPNSIYYASFEQHFSGEPSIVTKIPTWVYTVVITILSITGLLFASSLILRRQIRLKTHNLVVVNEELKTDIAKRRKIEMDLRQTQKRYKLLVEQVPMGIIEWDTNLNVIGWNKGAEKIFGIKTENALQRNCQNLGESNLFSEEPKLANKKNEISAILQELIKKPNFVHSQHKFDIRDPTVPKNHNQIITEWISTSLVSSDKSIFALISFVQDITEKISKDKEQIKIQKLQSIALLAGGIAHDFNNILVGILGNANLLQMEVPGSEDYQEYLTDLINAVQVAKGLTQQLLTFSKGGDPIKKTLSLIPILQDAISFSTHGAKSSVILDIRGENPVSDLDPGQISQVFNNLIINALQAMPNGGTITITTDIVQSINTHKIPLAQGKYIEITVKDEGIGIPEKFQNKIFEPYFTTKPKGNGIGLATCFSIIKKHQGFITFTSKPNEGTTFYVYLPISKPAIQKEEEVSKKRNHFSGKILLMDDDKQVRNVLGKMLEHTGLEVEYSDNGEQTVKKFNFAIEKKIPYSLIILDLTIRGGMGGQETIKQIRKMDPNIKAIVSSGYSNSPVMAQFQQFGFDAVLKKPYSYDELLNILSKLL